MSEESFKVQTVVIGAGVIGLAVARTLARSGREVLLLEAGPRIGEGISSRNSEVIHAGIYYPEGSLKARCCVEGRQQLYDYCQSHKVSHRKCGKWIIAIDQIQTEQLESIRQKAENNGVQLHHRDGASIRREIPAINANAGLWSEETGIIDSHGLMLALQGDFEDAGGQLALNSPVVAIETSGSGSHRLTAGGETSVVLEADEVINAAGLGAPAIAQNWQGLPELSRPRQWLARGVYFSYSGKHPFNALIYPLPEPGGLGVHLTLDLAGQARFGPDVEWIETEDYSVNPERVHAFSDGIQKWWPNLDKTRLQPAYAGIRPKLTGPDGDFFDFRIDGPEVHGLEGVVNLFGIESPGLTSCLAIAEKVKEKLENH
ncbi:MAG: NAD(P)/FAD-dependent oxidoreductase [Marinobacter sp.]|nr:NAD(P)/FAD-dependent oxidoreductase [Marinobacter sp.]